MARRGVVLGARGRTLACQSSERRWDGGGSSGWGGIPHGQTVRGGGDKCGGLHYEQTDRGGSGDDGSSVEGGVGM